MRIYVRVVPRASFDAIEQLGEHEYRIRMTAPPIQGRANEKLIEILSKHFHVAKSLIVIVGGKSTRTKIVDIAD
ncbi:MAG: DUF167 domain-containing protein [Candidatus Moranbacteria bacterium]|nr:DUF167 domain-containing protein [Candidatus Moranbacteria bacterium]